MKHITRTMFAGSIGLILSVAGCKGGPAKPDEARSEALAPVECEGMNTADATLDRKTSTQDAEPHGPRALIGAALQKVCLDEEQRSTVEQIGERVTAKEQTVVDARHALRAAILDGLRAGQIDESALGDEIDALVKAREGASPVLRKGLEDLHERLDSGQRAALADAIQSRVQELTKSSASWLDTLATDLALSDDQKQKIGDLLEKSKPQIEEERARAGKVFDAFEKDEFAMDRIAPIDEVGERTRERAVRMVGIAKELAGILTPDQRNQLATKLADSATEPAPGPAQGETTDTTSADTTSADTTSADTTSVAEDGLFDQFRQGVVVARGRGYRAGRVGGWGGRGVAVAGGRSSSTVVVVNPSPYVVGYPLTPGYGPGVW